jgi:hypothetical protein
MPEKVSPQEEADKDGQQEKQHFKQIHLSNSFARM